MGISTEKADAGITADRLRFVLRGCCNKQNDCNSPGFVMNSVRIWPVSFG